MASESDRDTTRERFDVERRSLLKALSAGGALALGSGSVAGGDDYDRGDDGEDARGDDGEEGNGAETGAESIHPLYGFSSPDGGEPPEGIEPDHAVDLLVYEPGPPEGPPGGDGGSTGEGDDEPAGGEGEAGSGEDDGYDGDGSGDGGVGDGYDGGGSGDEADDEPGDGDADEAPPALDHPPLFAFEPVGLHASPGDVVRFTFTTPDHTVTAYHPGHGFQQRVPDGVGPFSSPAINAGGYWLYRFDEPGVYDVYCGPHHFFGMVMRIVVGDDASAYATGAGSERGVLSAENIEGLLNPFREGDCEWPLPTPADVFGTDALDPTAIREAGDVPFADVAAELGFDLGSEPDDERAPEATVRVDDHPEHGPLLVGPEGATLYVFDQDARGEPASACYDDCAENWPPLTVEDEPTAGEGVEAELTTVEREDGTRQVAAGGWPLYSFAGDEAPGDAAGQGVNDVWWVLRPDGTPVRDGEDE